MRSLFQEPEYVLVLFDQVLVLSIDRWAKAAAGAFKFLSGHVAKVAEWSNHWV